MLLMLLIKAGFTDGIKLRLGSVGLVVGEAILVGVTRPNSVADKSCHAREAQRMDPANLNRKGRLAGGRCVWEDIAAMLKIDRKAFLALAFGMNLAACAGGKGQPVVNTTGTGGTGSMTGKKMPPPHGEAGMAPHGECIEFSPAGECTKWEPTQECVAFDPSGECTKWEPHAE